MTDKIIPLIYVMALGFVALRLCNATFPAAERLGARNIYFFVALNVTGFLLTAFLPAPYAVFFVVVLISILMLAPVEPVPRIALYLFLVPLMPSLGYDLHIGIPLLRITWTKLLTILLLLPLLPGAMRRKPLLHFPLDKYIWAFFLLNAVLAFRDTSFTNGLRGITYLGLDFLVPYLVLSRYLRNLEDIRHVLFALLAALFFAACVNVFETFRTWHLYEQLRINISGARFMAIERLGMLRATGPFSIPSQSAFALSAGLGICWALLPQMRKPLITALIAAVLAAGIFVTFSRGNWIGGAIIGMAFLFTANRKQFFRLSVVLLLLWGALAYFDVADDVAAILPFVGAEDTQAAGTVDYRAQLLETSLQVANENPWFGSSNFHEHPDMEALRQSSGLLDLVNQYVIVLLNSGYTGLILYVAMFVSGFAALARVLLKATGIPEEQRTLFRALFFTLTGLLVAATTTSAMGRTGMMLWCLLAISAVATEHVLPRRTAAGRVSSGNEARAHR